MFPRLWGGAILSIVEKTDDTELLSETIQNGKFNVSYNTADANYIVLKATMPQGEEELTTITAKSYTREYGDTNPVFEYTSEGAALDGEPEIFCEATETSPVGTYDIVVKQGTVKNYNVNYVDGTLTIAKAPLTIKAGEYTMKQGDALPEFIASYEGWKNDDTEAVLTKQPTLTTTATSGSEPGTYEVVVSGAEAQNYEISYTKGILIIEENLDGIDQIMKNKTDNVMLFTIDGRRVDKLKKGLYIIRMKDGTIRKEVVRDTGIE